MSEITAFIKSLFRTPTAEIMALKELEESKRKLLEAQSAREYSESMVKYYESKIKRLTIYLHAATKVD